MTKIKMKWWREGVDNHENLFLVPVDKLDRDSNEDDKEPSEFAVAWIMISYDRTRFYHGRGGEGTSRPDSYVAYVKDGSKERIIEDGADCKGDVGSILNTKMAPAFRTIRAAKAAITRALAALAAREQWAPSSKKECDKREPCNKDAPCVVHVSVASERILNTPEARAAELATVQSDVDMAGPTLEERAWGKEHLTGYTK